MIVYPSKQFLSHFDSFSRITIAILTIVNSHFYTAIYTTQVLKVRSVEVTLHNQLEAQAHQNLSRRDEYTL